MKSWDLKFFTLEKDFCLLATWSELTVQGNDFTEDGIGGI